MAQQEPLKRLIQPLLEIIGVIISFLNNMIMYYKGQGYSKEAYDRIMARNAKTPKVEAPVVNEAPIVAEEPTIQDLRDKYKDKNPKEKGVPPRYINDKEWIQNKINEFTI